MNPSPDYDPLAAYTQPTLSERLRASLANRDTRSKLLLSLLLIAATFLLYGGFLSNPLVLDDANVLNQNSLSAMAAGNSLSTLRWLSYATFGLTYKLVGMDWAWYRIGNICLHATTAILLFTFFLRLLTTVVPDPNRKSHYRTLAFSGALFFTVHPVSVYGVAYLVERSILMATLFGVASLLCFLEGLIRKGNGWFVGSGVFFVLAVFSKEHVITLPAVAIAMSLLLRRPSIATVRRMWLPAVLLVALGSVIAYLARHAIGNAYEPTAFEIFSQMRRHQMGPTLENAYPLSILTQGYLFFQYLLIWIVPYTGWMSIDVRHPFATHLITWPQSVGFVAFLAYPVVAIRLLFKGGRAGLFGLGMLFPWLLFLVELTTVRVSEVFVLYRSYLWMSGLPLVALALLCATHKKTPAMITGLVVCIVLVPLAWNRLETFSDEVRLWSDAIESNAGKKNQGTERGYIKRGLAYLGRGRYEDAITDFRQAHALNTSNAGYADVGNRGVVYFQFNYLPESAFDRAALDEQTRVIASNPGSGEAYMKRAKIWLRLERPDLAADDFSSAIKASPNLAAEALVNRAKTQIQLGEPRRALSDVGRALELRPRFAQAFMVRGTIRAISGDSRSALDDFQTAVNLDNKDAEIHFGLGNVFATQQRYDEALRSYGNAIERDSTMADAYANRGAILMHLNRVSDALSEYDKALRANPDHEISYLNRARLFLSQARIDDAMRDYERVLNLNHANRDALFNRGVLLQDQGLKKEARVSFQRGCNAGHSQSCDKLKAMDH